MVLLLVSVAESALHKVASRALNSFFAHHFTRKPHTLGIYRSTGVFDVVLVRYYCRRPLVSLCSVAAGLLVCRRAECIALIQVFATGVVQSSTRRTKTKQ